MNILDSETGRQRTAEMKFIRQMPEWFFFRTKFEIKYLEEILCVYKNKEFQHVQLME
jgi:hypothetical protein